ncbi:MAG: hypothetical protein RL076_2408 [Chloroflexota bacterium]|jgi:hypothetical protein
MMNFLKNVVWVAVVLAVGIFILRMPAASGIRSLVLAEPVAVVQSAVPTPTLVPATSTVEPTGTATAIPTATKTPMPTLTPTATRYVVQVSAVERAVIAKKELTTYTSVQDVTLMYKKEQTWKFINNAQEYEYFAIYHVDAKFNLELMDVQVDSKTNKITITMPAPFLDTPKLVPSSVRHTYKPDQSEWRHLIVDSEETEWVKVAQIQALKEARIQACGDGLLNKATSEVIYVIKDLVLNIDPRINTRDITVNVPAGTCTK